MSVRPRQVKNKRTKNGASTGRAGTVYDVFIRYKGSDGYKTYGKRGFATKKEAIDHEAEMRAKLTSFNYEPIKAFEAKKTVKEYLETWLEAHSRVNLRPSTLAGYKSQIKNYIIPYIGHVPLKKLTPGMIDSLFQKLFDKGLSQSTVRYTQRILSVSLEAARKYRYIETNPARDILTKFGKQGKIPDPYTVEQMQQLMGNCVGTEWEMIFVLSGMYGLRRNEVLGLRWNNVDLWNKTFSIVEQMPYRITPGTKIIREMAPTKSNDRVLPITDTTFHYFERQLALQEKQRELVKLSGQEYFENNLVISKPNGAFVRPERVTINFAQMLRHLQMPHIRFHDLRHSAATNMHQLTGDFYTVGEILGHTLKGIGISLGISTNLEAVTAQYVDVRLERKLVVLNAYHDVLHPKESTRMSKKKHRKKSYDLER
jgi:integrase